MGMFRIETITHEAIVIHAASIEEAERLGRSVSGSKRNCKLHAVVDIEKEAALAATEKSA